MQKLKLKKKIRGRNKMAGNMTTTDQAALTEAVAMLNDGSDKTTEYAKGVQKRLKEKYGADVYRAARRVASNEINAPSPSPDYNPTIKKKARAVPKGMSDKKSAMKDGGMAYGKKHMYAAGGSVTMNPGLKALKAKSPEAFNKITG